MKSNFAPKTLVIAAVALAAAVTSRSAHGYTLLLTEVSSSVLTATYDGPGGDASFKVTNTDTDRWTVTVQSSTISLNNFEYDFAEPEDPTNQTVNEVANNPIFGASFNMYVKSDLPIELDSGGYIIGLFDTIGSDGSVPIILTYADLAGLTEAASSVPDSGSTLALLGVSVAGLFGLRRFRFPAVGLTS